MWSQLQKKFLTQTIPVINVHGIINPELTENVLNRINSINLNNAAALAVSVNSRGGLPAQSEIIAKKIMALADRKNLKVYMFAGDYAASGGYMILSYGHEIYADRTSLVGSIGVVLQSLSLGNLLKIGKAELDYLDSSKSIRTMLNPFLSKSEEDKEYLQQVCEKSHQKFIDIIKKNRKNKFKAENESEIFSAQVFSGQKVKQYGLIDEFGSLSKIMFEKYPDAALAYETKKKPWLLSLTSTK